jgi:5-oxoprolinase (ATP-hydrolysing)
MAHYIKGFEESHRREFGFNLEKRKIMIDNIRVRSIGKASVAT